MDSQQNDADAQMAKIQDEKTALRRQLIALVIMSVLVTGLFYGVTLMQNPYKTAWTRRWSSHQAIRKIKSCSFVEAQPKQGHQNILANKPMHFMFSKTWDKTLLI